MTRIAVVEDDERHRAVIADHLRRYSEENGKAFKVSNFADGSEIVSGYQPMYDIVFLDIEMPGVDGMAAARHIRGLDSDVVLVFITASPQYAISGYEVAALSYLLKPVPYFAFARELERSLEQVTRRERRFMMLTEAGERHRVDLSDILFVESLGHRILVRTVRRDYQFSGSLKAMEAELDGKGFFRCNNPYLVNLRHVIGVRQTSCILTGGRELQVSRPRRKSFLAALTDYVDEAGR